MAGRSRRRRRQGRPPLQPLPAEPSTLREISVAELPTKKTCHASSSTSSTTCGPDVWADLLDSLLLQIIALLSSFHDLLAFTGTCRSWRAALSSLPCAFTFNFPPLHLQPDGDDPHPPYRSYIKHSLLSNCKWQVVDPAKRTSSLRCSAPPNVRGCMKYIGCSYGYLIFSNSEQCLLVDAYSGATMRPPKLKFTGNHEIYYGMLVAPVNSSSFRLLFWSISSMFQWQVGSNSWSKHPLGGEKILQIVLFKGDMFAMDLLERLHRICLAPQFSMQEVAVVWGEDKDMASYKPWLVVCGDMLLLVDFSVSIDSYSGFSGAFKVFRLDFSVEPAKWVKVDNLGNSALFVSIDRRNPTFACMNPERWGGKSNCIYVASASSDSDETWSVVELGQTVPSTKLCCTYGSEPILAPRTNVHCRQPQSLWMLPSYVYGVGR